MLAGSLALLPRVAHAVDYREAPALKTRADAGQLPPVAARLPEAPVVVQPHEAVGRYGGVWRISMAGPSDYFTLYRRSATRT
jgi:peptide/nickel transport system substrate-binding protein